MYTPYHSLYWATALTLRGSGGSMDRLSQSIANAKVDLNPHQVDAALFAVRSPLSKGAILADEVGLGKTIEAAIVIAQRWAERKRRILLILPATLRKQWQQELLEKFSLPTVILESRSFRASKTNAFVPKDQIVICSYQFAAAKSAEIRDIPWDLVVIDEAHRLRNIYKGSNTTATAIAQATSHAPKILLTATPLQNSLMELYGLVSVIDPHVFGDAASFRDQFVKAPNEIQRNMGLKDRLAPICTRTLRKQVLEYVRFTQRIPITQDFIPTDAEHELYQQVSAYLQRPELYALPVGQRTLITLILRKLLASSSFAIAGTLQTLIARLETVRDSAGPLTSRDRQEAVLDTPPADPSTDDFESQSEYEEEWPNHDEAAATQPTKTPNPKLLKQEIQDLQSFLTLAHSVSVNAKGDALIKALETAFLKATALGAARKAVIFTESRRTQRYLFDLLTAHSYANQIVLINGTNTDEGSARTYDAWRERHTGTDAISTSRSADMKAALVEEFRDRKTLLIATESAAEGVNLQFCSLVVNYDLPWNPQRIEQRIGRCHRYGQKHDVVVVNFLNRRNAADQRVFQLLSQKFRLFDGIFGSSDEVLGALESGVDLEKRIAQVYQECRTPTEIEAAFDQLQAELDETIGTRLAETRRVLLENFDEEVHARMRVHREQAIAALSTRQRWLLELTKQELGADAQFADDEPRFTYTGHTAPQGAYNFDWKQAEERGEHFYRLGAPLADSVIAQALDRQPPVASLEFRYRDHGTRISVLDLLVGRAGWLQAGVLTVNSLDTEEHLILAACMDDNTEMEEETARKLLSLHATEKCAKGESVPPTQLTTLAARRQASILDDLDRRNGRHFDEEVIKLDRWADDLKLGLEREIKDIDQQIRDTRRMASAAASLTEKLSHQKEVKALEVKRNLKRRELFEAQDDIDKRRDSLIGGIEAQLKQTTGFKPLFTIRWSVV
jgi:adenine-specific DNA-methyltransferase